MKKTQPLVSCLMVTRNRRQLARRAVECLVAQTWAAKELIIVDDGAEDYEPMLAPYRELMDIRYHRLDGDRREPLGALRNRSLDLASGEYLIQWDDDEWYHPSRIEVQMQAATASGIGAVVLKYTLMHLDEPGFIDRPYRGVLSNGTPGTVLHRRCPEVRYPETRKGEDTVFLRRLGKRFAIKQLDASWSHLFVRCFHGANTWDRRHFLKRLRRTPADMLRYAHAAYWKRDIGAHAAFALTSAERETLRLFLAHSEQLSLLSA